MQTPIGRTYSTAEPNKVSGRIVIPERGDPILIPAFRWLPAQRMTRKQAAATLRQARRLGPIMCRPSMQHELEAGK